MASSFPIQHDLGILFQMTFLQKASVQAQDDDTESDTSSSRGQQARKMQTRTKKKLQFLSWSENVLRQELREKANSTPGTEFRDAFTPSLMKVALLSHVADQSTTGISSC